MSTNDPLSKNLQEQNLVELAKQVATQCEAQLKEVKKYRYVIDKIQEILREHSGQIAVTYIKDFLNAQGLDGEKGVRA